MRSPTKQDGTRNTERRAKAARAATSPKGESHVEPTATAAGAKQGGVVTSMVDALEDILKWERASERAMRVATEQSTTELDPSN
jgi:hypothetical protein